MTDLFAGIVGQDRAVAVLSRALAEGEAHAYLFVGPDGVGKTMAARAFAAGLICRDRGCGACSTCQRVLAGALHPDLKELIPEGNVILKGEVMEILKDAVRRPFEPNSRAKVYIVHEADSMNAEAANAFLRTLEEPPSNARFILITERPDRLLPTVVSRCQQVAFLRVSGRAIAEYLSKKHEVPPGQAAQWARLAGGDLSYAVELAAGEGAQRRRERLLELARDLPESSFADVEAALDEIMAIVDARAEARASELELERQKALEWAENSRAKNKVEKEFAERIKRQRRRLITQGLDIVAETFASWYRDLALVAVGAEETVVNHHRLEELRLFVYSENLLGYVKAVEASRRAQEMLRYNVDARCAIGSMLRSIKEALI